MDIESRESQDIISASITLTPEQSLKFQAAIKTGLYKELHRKGLLTDAQLKQLVSMQNT